MWNQLIHGIPDVLVLIVLFGFSIFIHELGHFLAARWCGFEIRAFSIGFGPALWKRKVNGVVYKIGALPFGGYVALPQLDPAGMEKIQGKGDDAASADGDAEAAPGDEASDEVLAPVAAWKKIVVSLAGPCGNILFAVLLAWIVFWHPGGISAGNSTDIGYVATNSVAYAAGLRPGDRVIAVSGATVATWDELREEALLRRRRDGADDRVRLAIERGGAQLEVELPVVGPREGDPLGGTLPGYEPVMLQVEPDGSAARAGLRRGDRIVSLDGDRIVGAAHLDRLMASRTGETGVVTVKRDGERLALTVELPFTGAGQHLPALVGQAMPGSSAAAAGLRRGDEILAFNGEPVLSREHLAERVQAHGEAPATLTFQRGSTRLETTVTPAFDDEAGRYLVGILWAFDPGVPWMRYHRPWAQVRNDARGILRILRALVTRGEAGSAAGALGGPVMIFAALWAAIQVSLMNAVGFLRFLNVNLAILNLLPIPVLDGGHIVFALWEIVTRRRPHPRVVNILVNAFAILLLAVFLLLTLRDVNWLFPRLREAFSRSEAVPAETEP